MERSTTVRGLALRATILGGLLGTAGCGSEEPPAARTESLETVASPSSPEETILPPAHAPIPSWVPAELHEAIEASRLPVMLPRDAQLLARAQVLSEDRWVSARLETSTYIAVIFGTDAHHEPPRGASFALPEPDRTIRGEPGYAYENEGLYQAQWSEDGVAWDVEIDCLGASCAGVELATSLAEQLEPVGGVR